jgi:hypothetical protein
MYETLSEIRNWLRNKIKQKTKSVTSNYREISTALRMSITFILTKR